MKSTILNLKERVLVVEMPRLSDYEFINRDSKYLRVGNEEINLNISTFSKINLICGGSELSEEIAKQLSERTGEGHPSYQGDWYIDYSDDDKMCDSALDSFISAIEANGYYWSKNPLGDEPNHLDYKFEKYKGEMHFISERHKNDYADKWELWQEAESKTFHPEQVILFEIL